MKAISHFIRQFRCWLCKAGARSAAHASLPTSQPHGRTLPGSAPLWLCRQLSRQVLGVLLPLGHPSPAFSPSPCTPLHVSSPPCTLGCGDGSGFGNPSLGLPRVLLSSLWCWLDWAHSHPCLPPVRPAAGTLWLLPTEPPAVPLGLCTPGRGDKAGAEQSLSSHCLPVGTWLCWHPAPWGQLALLPLSSHLSKGMGDAVVPGAKAAGREVGKQLCASPSTGLDPAHQEDGAGHVCSMLPGATVGTKGAPAPHTICAHEANAILGQHTSSADPPRALHPSVPTRRPV